MALGRLALSLMLLAVLEGSPRVYAQVASGNLQGIVTDAGMEPLPGASIALFREGSGRSEVSSEKVADKDGKFIFENLEPGSYRIQVKLEGFKPLEYDNIAVKESRGTGLEIVLNKLVDQASRPSVE